MLSSAAYKSIPVDSTKPILLLCRFGFIDNLNLGGPVPIGARQANLTEATRPFLEEVALNEQGHALFTRQAGSTIPCPLVDFTAGFNAFFAAAYSLPANVTVQQAYGAPFGKPCCLGCSLCVYVPCHTDMT